MLGVIGTLAAAVGAGVIAVAGLNRLKSLRAVEPELRMAGLLLPISLTPWLRSLVRARKNETPRQKMPSDVEMIETFLDRPCGGEPMRVLIFQRATQTKPPTQGLRSFGFMVGDTS